jgi:hypothetical protein
MRSPTTKARRLREDSVTRSRACARTAKGGRVLDCATNVRAEQPPRHGTARQRLKYGTALRAPHSARRRRPISNGGSSRASCGATQARVPRCNATSPCIAIVAPRAEQRPAFKTTAFRARDISQRRSRTNTSIAFGMWRSGRITFELSGRQGQAGWSGQCTRRGSRPALGGPLERRVRPRSRAATRGAFARRQATSSPRPPLER